ncbi:hypothetical protein IWX49DRAFT_551374 [Phyllosticta citricarpa]|uniref:Secreted protein n=1 Tax=Phyllosticta citricarpa TaxID=55181 RepID=A0ABR1LUK5_9PEZI
MHCSRPLLLLLLLLLLLRLCVLAHAAIYSGGHTAWSRRGEARFAKRMRPWRHRDRVVWCNRGTVLAQRGPWTGEERRLSVSRQGSRTWCQPEISQSTEIAYRANLVDRRGRGDLQEGRRAWGDDEGEHGCRVGTYSGQ